MERYRIDHNKDVYMNLKERIKELASEFADEIKDVRRHLHMHPELSYEEKETGKYIVCLLYTSPSPRDS